MQITKYTTPQDYLDIRTQEIAYTQNRTSESEDQLWSMEHTPCFTIGSNGTSEDILANPDNLPVIQDDRGGGVTYMGPGMIAVHTLVGFVDKPYSVAEFINRLEAAVVATLSSLGIVGTVDPDNSGVFVGDAKIASVGLTYVNRAVYHGIVLYWNVDKSQFNNIVVCGHQGQAVTDVVSLGGTISYVDLEELFLNNIVSQLT